MIEWSDTIIPCQILTTIQIIWESWNNELNLLLNYLSLDILLIIKETFLQLPLLEHLFLDKRDSDLIKIHFLYKKIQLFI